MTKILTPPMFYHPPLGGKYNGITLVFSNPSRFDTERLGSGKAGTFMEQTLNLSGNTRLQCDIVQANNIKSFRPGTKVAILFGEHALRKLGTDKFANLLQHRGYPTLLPKHKLWAIPTFAPQECMDMFAAWETTKNEYHIPSEEADNKDDGRGKKGATARANYRFWFQRDVCKAVRIVENSGKLPQRSQCDIITDPNPNFVVKHLSSISKGELFLDLETDSDKNITCFGYAFNDEPKVVVVWMLNYLYQANPFYHKIYLALLKAMRRNVTVCHNGASFDWLLLAWKYKAPLGKRMYDTMIAQHRCFPEIEKSLGHCVSLWTYEPYHKDEGVFNPHNATQQQQLWEYCGKDVNTMRLVKREIDAYAKETPGLEDSIRQGNASIRPYLTITLIGMRYDRGVRDNLVARNDKMMTFILRMFEILIGHKFIPSNKQCNEYFHRDLGYKVMAKSSKTGAPSLAKDAMYKLKLAYPGNPVIDLCLQYRSIQRDTGVLTCKQWSDEEYAYTTTHAPNEASPNTNEG